MTEQPPARPPVMGLLTVDERLTLNDYDPTVHRPRLVRLIDHLKEVARRDAGSFDLTTWFGAETAEDTEIAMEEWPRRWAAGEELDCGTTACLVGHLPLAFPEDFGWSKRLYYVVTTAKLGGFLAENMLDQFFGLRRAFWSGAIFLEGYFWRGRIRSDDVVTAAEMAALLEEALAIADQERPAPVEV